MRVVLLILDGLPARHVGPALTPTLHRLASEGGWRPEGGRSVMASSTYANHRTFATGVGPGAHGIAANEMPDGRSRVPADTIPMTVPTVFDAARSAGMRSELVVGDHHLVAVMGGDRADAHWPPGGTIPDGSALDELGYLDDVATVPEVRRGRRRAGPTSSSSSSTDPTPTATSAGPTPPTRTSSTAAPTPTWPPSSTRSRRRGTTRCS